MKHSITLLLFCFSVTKYLYGFSVGGSITKRGGIFVILTFCSFDILRFVKIEGNGSKGLKTRVHIP